MPAESSFAGKFIKKIKKIDSEQVESFLAQVLREKAFLEVILDSLNEGVIVAEETMRIVYINESARQLLGLLRTETINKRMLDVIKTAALVEIANEFNETREAIRRREVMIQTPRGPRIYSITVEPVQNEEAVDTHSVWLISDRTDYVRRQKEKMQIENMESLAVLTAGIAHEVKNPLNSLNIHAQLANKAARDIGDRHPEEQATNRLERSTGVIIEEIERLKRVVDDFIRAVRPVKPALRKASLNNMLSQLADLMEPDCNNQGINLVLNLDPEIPLILIDSEQLYQVFLNILKNAIEAIEKEEGKISIRTMLKSDHVLIEIEDNGVGIPEEERMKIFEPYHSTKFNGTGLGLVLVYRIVKAHHGAIAVKSEVGEGTVFSVAIPIDERPIRLLTSEAETAIEREGEKSSENSGNP